MEQQARKRQRIGRPATGEERPKRKVIGGSILETVAEKLERRADEENRSVSSIVAEIVERAFEHETAA